jgi:hypothetical protein
MYPPANATAASAANSVTKSTNYSDATSAAYSANISTVTSLLSMEVQAWPGLQIWTLCTFRLL